MNQPYRVSTLNAVLFGLLALGVAGAESMAAAPSPSPTPSPTPVLDRQAEAVVTHLNETLSWYREAQESNGWVVQASDAFYRDNQKDLANEVVVNSFNFGHAMAGVISVEGQASSKPVVDTRKQRLAARIAANNLQLASLRSQEAQLKARLTAVAAGEQPALAAELEVIRVNGRVELTRFGTSKIDPPPAMGDGLFRL